MTEDKVWCPVRALKYYWLCTKDRRSGDQLFFITREPFPLLREKSFRSGLWLLSEQLAPRCCRLWFRPVHMTPGVSVHPGRCSLGSQSRRFKRQPFWRTPNSFISFLSSGCLRRGADFLSCSSVGVGSFPLIPYTAFYGGHAARPPAQFCVGLAYNR